MVFPFGVFIKCDFKRMFKIVIFWQLTDWLKWQFDVLSLNFSGTWNIYLSIENLTILTNDHQPEVRIWRDVKPTRCRFSCEKSPGISHANLTSNHKSMIDRPWDPHLAHPYRTLSNEWHKDEEIIIDLWHVNYKLKSDNLLVVIPAGICNAICGDRSILKV